MKQDSPAQGLDGVGIFANLDPAAKSEIAARLETEGIRRGATLMRQGEVADALYIVVSGRFGVYRDGRSVPLSEIGAGQPIGEIGFLTGAPRNATVVALRDSLVLKLRREEFDDLAATHPAIWPAMTVAMAHRLAATVGAAAPPPDPKPRTIAILRAGTDPLPENFVSRLAGIFGRHATMRTLTSETARQLLGSDIDLDGDQATRRLNELEEGLDHVIFIADPDLTPWSDRAIRHADLVLAVARHSSGTALNPLERRAHEILPPDAHRLVLLHDRRSRISGTARWLAERPLAMHHHVALDRDDDMERLYRFIAGTARGLVACGGGAFCAAHLGVYKALVEHGCEFDIMGGTSGGAAMTAAFILNGDPDDIDGVLHDMFVTHKAMRRYTLPRYSILDHSNFDAQLQRHFGGVGIEDMWLPFFAVSTNLSRYTLHTHRTGNLWTAIRASAAIPVLLPPVYTRDGEMLVDGCLLDNVPIRSMHELKSGPNVVVSFEMPALERFAVDYETLPTRSELFRLAINPLRRQALPSAPNLKTVLMRSLMANRHDFSRHLGPEDLLLVPELPQDMGLLDWHRHTELCEASYRWTLAELGRRGAAPSSHG